MTLDLRFHPLITWPAKATPEDKRRSRWTFKASWQDTLDMLEAELEKLDATDIVVSAALQAEHIRMDGWPRAGATPRHPGIMLSFTSKTHGPLRYLTDTHEFWQHNLRAIALGLQALRAVDRYGITQSGEQYKGWLTIEETSSSTKHARDFLSGFTGIPLIDIPLTTDKTKAMYKKALRLAHPDQGGNPGLLARVMDAGRKLGVA